MDIFKYKSDFYPQPCKYRKLNPIGENVYLLPDGTIIRDEDKIVACQRIWKERAYVPVTGIMYQKGLERFTSHDKSGEQCSVSK